MRRAYHFTNLMVLIFIYLGFMKLIDWDPVVYLHMRKLWAKFARVSPLTFLGITIKAETYRDFIGLIECYSALMIFVINHFGAHKQYRNFCIYCLIFTSALWLYTEQMFGANFDAKSFPLSLILLLILLRFIGKLEMAVNRGQAQRQRQQQVQRPGMGFRAAGNRQLAPAQQIHRDAILRHGVLMQQGALVAQQRRAQ